MNERHRLNGGTATDLTQVNDRLGQALPRFTGLSLTCPKWGIG